MKTIFVKWNFKKHIICSFFLIIILKILLSIIELISWKILGFKASGSVAIIGGADGPTAIYVTSKNINIFTGILPWFVFFIMLLLLYIPVRKIFEELSNANKDNV